MLKETSTTVSNDKTTFKIGAKASNNKTSGTYENVINFTVVGNPKHLFMQDIDTWRDTLVSTGDAIVAVDIRDGKEYWVGRQADGKIWMTQNLDFNLDSNRTLTSKDTDLISFNVGGYTEANGYSKNGDVISWTPIRGTADATNVVINNADASFTGWSNSKYSPYSVDIGEYYTDGSWYDSDNDCKDENGNNAANLICENHISKTPYESNGKHGAIGNYYNWSAAVAANTTNVSPWTSSTLSNISNNPQNSICPAGWRLPTISDQNYAIKNSTNEFARLNYLNNDDLVETDVGLFSSPLYFSRAGIVLNRKINNIGYEVFYWSSTVEGPDNAYNLYTYSWDVAADNSSGRSFGFSVRCVARDPIYYMQDVAKWENKIPNTGDSMVAVDKRDGKEYWVGRLGDGKIWMTQNLDFNLDSNITLTSADTDLISFNVGGYTEANGYSKNGDVISWTPANSTINATTINITDESGDFTGWSNNDHAPYSVDVGERYIDGAWYDSDTDCKDEYDEEVDNYGNCENHISNTPYEINGKHGAMGNYYNWTAAIATNNSNVTEWGSSTRNDVSKSPQNSICPAEWRLPTISSENKTLVNSTNEFARLNYLHNNNLTNTNIGLFNSPLYFVRAGQSFSGGVYGVGQHGSYWSSTIYNTNRAYYIYFYSGSVNLSSEKYHYFGSMIRCVAR